MGSGARLSLDAYRQVEVKKLLTSELSLRVLPPRKLLGLLPHPVVVRAEASARQLNLSLDSLALDQRAIGQLLCQNDKVLTLNVGCAGIPPSYTDHLSWGFMDDCLRVSNVTPNDQSIAPERKATYALDSAGPVSVVAISQEGRLMITGSAVQPVLHLWSLHRLAKKQPSASSSSRRQPPLTNVGTLVSTLHSGTTTCPPHASAGWCCTDWMLVGWLACLLRRDHARGAGLQVRHPGQHLQPEPRRAALGPQPSPAGAAAAAA